MSGTTVISSQKPRCILSPPFLVTLGCIPAAFHSVACSGIMLLILTVGFSQCFAEVTEAEAHTGKITVSQKAKTVKDDSSTPTTLNSVEKQLVLQAMQDLGKRLSISVDKITLLEIRKVTWPDSSLGCPQAGVVYDQVPQDGFLIRLQFQRQMYFYHSAGKLNPFLCVETSKIVPHPRKGEEFVPPPGIKID